ncbi:hypothetical protein LR48_Vigan06g104700 [Vigna angularis]|uniref:Uncharacterized protein n=1 Tax=Phaseolus angularis TaxID=3914 RepID=A0A0L9USP2_PHAAN|nr:hypothetical protein LR48_Vigan06g104700 [Vigna angularis]
MSTSGLYDAFLAEYVWADMSDQVVEMFLDISTLILFMIQVLDLQGHLVEPIEKGAQGLPFLLPDIEKCQESGREDLTHNNIVRQVHIDDVCSPGLVLPSYQSIIRAFHYLGSAIFMISSNKGCWRVPLTANEALGAPLVLETRKTFLELSIVKQKHCLSGLGAFLEKPTSMEEIQRFKPSRVRGKIKEVSKL